MILMHIAQYFVHLIMHKYLYKYHKQQHYFKHPEPWDGLYVHLIEMYMNVINFFLPCLLMWDNIGLIEILIAHSIFYLELGISHTAVKTGIKCFFFQAEDGIRDA